MRVIDSNNLPFWDEDEVLAKGNLTEEQLQAVWELFSYASGLPREIAKALGLPIGLVRSALEDPSQLLRGVVTKVRAARGVLYGPVLDRLLELTMHNNPRFALAAASSARKLLNDLEDWSGSHMPKPEMPELQEPEEESVAPSNGSFRIEDHLGADPFGAVADAKH